MCRRKCISTSGPRGQAWSPAHPEGLLSARKMEWPQMRHLRGATQVTATHERALEAAGEALPGDTWRFCFSLVRRAGLPGPRRYHSVWESRAYSASCQGRSCPQQGRWTISRTGTVPPLHGQQTSPLPPLARDRHHQWITAHRSSPGSH